MGKKIVVSVIVGFMLLQCGLFMARYIRMQDKTLHEVKRLELSGLMAARKANIPMLTGAGFIVIPRGLTPEQFRVWLQKNNVEYVVWSVVEYQARPLLRDLSWTQGMIPIFKKDGWGFIAQRREE